MPVPLGFSCRRRISGTVPHSTWLSFHSFLSHHSTLWQGPFAFVRMKSLWALHGPRRLLIHLCQPESNPSEPRTTGYAVNLFGFRWTLLFLHKGYRLFSFFLIPETSRLGCADLGSRVTSFNFLQSWILWRTKTSRHSELGLSSLHTCCWCFWHHTLLCLLLWIFECDSVVWKCCYICIEFLRNVPFLRQTLRELCRGGKRIFPLPSEFLAETPELKDRLTRGKQAEVYSWDTWEIPREHE